MLFGLADSTKIRRCVRNATSFATYCKRDSPSVFEKHREVCPQFYFCDQGSYDMDMGTKPLDGDYDIDQGQYFLVGIEAYPDPVVLKERVYEALVGHTNDVRIRLLVLCDCLLSASA